MPQCAGCKAWKDAFDRMTEAAEGYKKAAELAAGAGAPPDWQDGPPTEPGDWWVQQFGTGEPFPMRVTEIREGFFVVARRLRTAEERLVEAFGSPKP